MEEYISAKKLLISIALLLFLGYVAVSEEANLQWAEGVSAKLHRGESLTYKGYEVKAVVFPPPVESDKYKEVPAEPVNPYAGLNISKDGVFIGTVILGTAESYITPDNEMRITVKELPTSNAKEWLYESYDPWVVVEMTPRGIPKLEISLDTDKDKYLSSSAQDIVATVKLENKGSANAYDIDMEINTGLSLKKGSLRYHYEEIKTGESITETITFSLPLLREQKRFEIFANATGYDIKHTLYSTNVSVSVLVAPEPQKSLSIRKSVTRKIYLKDYALVSLYVKNNGIYDLKNVSIRDHIPKSFKLLGNRSLHWVVDIPANGEWEERYLIKPVQPNRNGIILPSATAEFRINSEFYSIQSNQPEIIVYGPKIVLTKHTDVTMVNPGGKVTVTVTAENIGSTPTRVIIRDSLPYGVNVINGNTEYETFLEANKKVSFSYTIRISKPVRLPPATAEYFELGNKGKKLSINSQEVEIRIRAPAPTPRHMKSPPAPSPTPSPAIVVTPTPEITPHPESKSNSANLTHNVKQSRHHVFFMEYILRCNDNNVKATLSVCNFFRHDKN